MFNSMSLRPYSDTTNHAIGLQSRRIMRCLLNEVAANGSSEAGSARKLVSVRLELGGSI